eukprot:TRINITY_DN17631_c0_g2_i2.p1 TRINITY_DN17631_c0_g2~~TRINITY_DN17631_c0_g2_i2.p1  ORF type:complete len:356 (+),score=76.64 TRINITY_DN17631_c0_g2_i2:79-1146(+)
MSLDKGATALSVALLKCFGEDGDCRIVVRAPSEGDEQTPKEGEPASKSIKGEFRVWSKLLCAWSDVFNAMFTHDFKEASEGTVVIVDFSVSAVAAFLRFMYCGNLHCDDEHLLEVAALADKYAVTQLQEDCEKRLGSALTVQSACEMLRAADRMGTPTLKAKTFDFVCQHGKEALKNGYVLGMSLLNEVLDAKALCLDDFTLATTMLEWLQAPAAQPCNIDVESLCRRHVHFAALDDTQYGKIKTLASTVDMEEVVHEMRSRCKRGETTPDYFSWLYAKWNQVSPNTPFMGFWINAIPSRANLMGFSTGNALSGLCSYLGNQSTTDEGRLRLQQGDSWHDYQQTPAMCHAGRRVP